ncbi:hypothetical protein CHLRE_12g526091v5 [Chlamydomonas reinhardtii]|uniref:Uncharacterized protein n=1 Tax=Chlamydomonas reinhardtii TaxID=3055 RepID=A0A2K3D4F7_CHLRE|nr:uncharacterized protein CHLRE_12g526091v5 [Chlamydomonas reinhardtii]PNW75415.1 hypothetical protein CHLRE_12g526091v5 [Chlamydomonas reinhardtii]
MLRLLSTHCPCIRTRFSMQVAAALAPKLESSSDRGLRGAPASGQHCPARCLALFRPGRHPWR